MTQVGCFSTRPDLSLDPLPGCTWQQCPRDVPQCHQTRFLSAAGSHAAYKPSSSPTPIQTAVTFGYRLLPPPCSTFAVHCRWAHPHRHKRKGDPGYKTMNTKHAEPQERKRAQRTWMALDKEMLLMCAWNPLILFSKGLPGQQQPARRSSIKTSINLLTVSFSYLLSVFISFK